MSEGAVVAAGAVEEAEEAVAAVVEAVGAVVEAEAAVAEVAVAVAEVAEVSFAVQRAGRSHCSGGPTCAPSWCRLPLPRTG